MLVRISAWPGRVAAWLLIGIIIAVLLAVLGSLLRLGVLLSWEMKLPLLGDQLTLTGLADIQWHLFGLLIMLGGVYALARDRHVRVDFLYANVSTKTKTAIDVLGHIFLLLPFCATMFWLSLSFVEFSWRSGEGSDYGGLEDRWLIKCILPIGFFLFALCGLGQILAGIAKLLGSHPSDENAGKQNANG
ncbi:MAG: TRAP transporter small permease subunit [Rhodovibrionaceae bacterium]